MSLGFRIFSICIVVIYFLILVFFIKKKMLALKYVLTWLLAGIVVGIFAIWPEVLAFCVELVGIEMPVNGLFVIAIFFIVLIVLSLTAIVSGQTEKINILVQENALLEKRIRELEESRDNKWDNFYK